MGASAAIDRTLRWLKWPAGLASAALLPGALQASWDLLQAITAKPAPVTAMGVGFGLYAILWWVLLRKRIMGSYLSTLEHELTHALFALLTFHPVNLMKIRTSWNEGGQMTFRGEGNWLISLAPYFFPTVSVVIVGISLFTPAAPWIPYVLGASLSYHGLSTCLETHLEQSDIHRAGLYFSVLFLPSANVFSYGLLIAWAHSGWTGTRTFLSVAWTQTLQLLTTAGDQVLPLLG